MKRTGKEIHYVCRIKKCIFQQDKPHSSLSCSTEPRKRYLDTLPLTVAFPALDNALPVSHSGSLDLLLAACTPLAEFEPLLHSSQSTVNADRTTKK